jgi:hypothetical protein
MPDKEQFSSPVESAAPETVAVQMQVRHSISIILFLYG